MKTTPMTELNAVNEMLSVIGEAPVNSLEASGLGEANLAHQILQFTCREVQVVGWHWNTDEDFPISPDSEGFLRLPPNTLKVDTSGYSMGLDLVQRGGRLYDRKNHTFVFDIDLVTVDLTTMLDFDELPEAARYYVTLRSVRKFQDRTVGANSPAYTARDEEQAFVLLKEEDMLSGDHNIFTGSATLSINIKR